MNDASIHVSGIGLRLPPDLVDIDRTWGHLLAGSASRGRVVPGPHGTRTLLADDPHGSGEGSPDGLLGNIRSFDARAFGLSADEATVMDPQQRLLLEAAWECLADAGYSWSGLRGERVGVFVGAYAQDWLLTVTKHGDRSQAATGAGVSMTVLPNRISYLLDVTGPSLLVDTACSSSLSAVHLAVNAIRAGECDRALVAGVSLTHDADISALTRASLPISATGTCRPFDSRADGIVRGEGALVFLLEGDLVSRGGKHGRILGTAIGHGGRTNGITAPSLTGQAETMRRALAVADIDPQDVRYVEAHGTGTILGDPIEAAALKSVYAHPDRTCFVGSVKGAFGHLEAAAGAAGLFNALQVARRGIVPPQQGFARESRAVAMAEQSLVVGAQATPITAPQGSYSTAVSSIGFGGSIAHVIVGAPLPARRHSSQPDGEGGVLLLSATTSDGVAAARDAIRHALRDLDDAEILSFAARQSRTAPAAAHRLAWSGADAQALRRAITSTPGGDPERKQHERAGTVLVFSGQGSSWPGMGTDLWAVPRLQPLLQRLEGEVAEITGWSLAERVCGDNFLDTQTAQVCTFAVQVAIVELLASRGISASAVVGHSMGEVTAATMAGALTTSAAIEILVARAATLEARARGGAMASVRADLATVEDLIVGLPGVTIAAHNGPTSTVVSGDATQVADAVARCQVQGLSAVSLPVDYAFHGPTLGGSEVATTVSASKPMTCWVSTVTGAVIDTAPDDAHWSKNVADPVLLVEAVRAAVSTTGAGMVLEVGPRSVLVADLEETFGDKVAVLGTMRAGLSPSTWLARAVADAFMAGVAVDTSRLIGWEPAPGPVVLTPWERLEFWPSATDAGSSPPAWGSPASTPTAGLGRGTPRGAPAPTSTPVVDRDELALFIAGKIAAALEGYDQDHVPVDERVSAWEVPSLTIVSIRNAVEEKYAVTAPLPMLLREDLTPHQIACRLVPEAPPRFETAEISAAAPALSPQPPIDSTHEFAHALSRIDELTDAEINALLGRLEPQGGTP